MDVPVEAVIAASATIFGILIGALVSELRTNLAERRAGRRARETARTARYQARLRETRVAIRHQIAQLEAIALGNLVDAERHDRAMEDLDSDITFVGDPVALRAWRDLVVELRGRMGKGLPPAYTVRMAFVLSQVMIALDEQEERLIAGEPIRRVTADEVPELFAPETMAAQLRLPWRLPSFSAVLARLGIDLLLWIDDHWPDRGSRGSPRSR
jgi:hypothetical protein